MNQNRFSCFNLGSFSDKISSACCGPRGKNEEEFQGGKTKGKGKMKIEELMLDSSDNSSEGSAPREKPLKKAITKLTSRPWAKKDDELLLQLVDKHNGRHWKEIANAFPGRTAPECNRRWKKLKPVKKRQHWDEEEDALLLSLIDQFSFDWAAICSKMPGRSGKQVRERYLNTLDPNINKGKWTKEEDETILQMFYQKGSKWKDISKALCNRPENMVKNRFYCHIRRKMMPQEAQANFEDEDNFTSESGSLSAMFDCSGSLSPEFEMKLRRSQGELDQVHEFNGESMEEEKMEEEPQVNSNRQINRTCSNDSISKYLDMMEEKKEDEDALEWAIQEVDDKLKQANSILSNSIATGSHLGLGAEITNLKMKIDALSSKKQELQAKRESMME